MGGTEQWFSWSTWLCLIVALAAVAAILVVRRHRQIRLDFAEETELRNIRLGIQKSSAASPRGVAEGKTFEYCLWIFAIFFVSFTILSGRIDLQNKSLALYKSGRSKYFEGNYLAAATDLSKSIKLNSHFAPAFCFRGAVNNELARFSVAVADCERAIKLDPKYAAAYRLRAVSRMSMGDGVCAVSDCDRAIELDPANVAAYQTRGLAKISTGDHAAAILDFNQAIELSPNSAELFNVRGNAYRSLKNYPSALADYRNAVRIEPQFLPAVTNLEFTKKLAASAK
jgi:tetratricopeptide (TPR) repeat protein